MENLKTEVAIIRDVQVLSLKPMKVSLKLVSDAPLNDHEVDGVKALVEKELKQNAEIEIVMAISR